MSNRLSRLCNEKAACEFVGLNDSEKDKGFYHGLGMALASYNDNEFQDLLYFADLGDEDEAFNQVVSLGE